MHIKYRLAATSTVVLALLGGAAFSGSQSGASATPATTSLATIEAGKTTAAAACAKCHGADYHGRPGFSPGITQSGELRHYTKPLFERLMKTGIDNDGKKVRKPMPTFGFPAAKSDALYTYLKTLK